jgi:2,4-didehydro-3-deoxy-L-rhamnonate hydrolase
LHLFPLSRNYRALYAADRSTSYTQNVAPPDAECAKFQAEEQKIPSKFHCLKYCALCGVSDEIFACSAALLDLISRLFQAASLLRSARIESINQMKLIRFGSPGREKPGILTPEGTRLDVSAFGHDYNEDFFDHNGLAELECWFKTHSAAAPIVDPGVRLGSPICRPSKIVCVGLNFRDHARESKMEIPKEPVIFFKSTTSLVGPNDDLILPRNSQKVDWEVELGVVIAKKATYVDRSDAASYVAGYVLHNDYSERVFQLERGGQWVKGKSADSFAPLGPFLATSDETPDVSQLAMWLKINGRIRQQSSTAEMIFDVPYLVSYVSQFMTLLPGDVISTGTPAGVGLGMNPPQYLKAGDIVELGIEGFGQSRQRVVEWSSAVFEKSSSA